MRIFLLLPLLTLCAACSTLPTKPQLRGVASAEEVRSDLGVYIESNFKSDLESAQVQQDDQKLTFPEIKHVYRGSARENYSVGDLFAYLAGNRVKEKDSWDYSSLLLDKIAQGESAEQARKETDLEIDQKIQNEIEALDMPKLKDLPPIKRLSKYLRHQMASTVAGIPSSEKSGTGISASYSPNGYPLQYSAKDQFKEQLKDPTNTKIPAYPAIILKIKSDPHRVIPVAWDAIGRPMVPPAPISSELVILSHIAPEQVEGAYFSVAKSTKIEDTLWFYVEVARNAEGQIDSIALYEAHAKVELKDTDRLDVISQIAQIPREGNELSTSVRADVEAKYPELKAGLSAMVNFWSQK